MTIIPFTKKFEDNSTEQGFQFTFYCDISNEQYKTEFVESKSGEKAERAHLIGKGLSMGGSFLKNIAPAIPGLSKSSVEKDAEKGGSDMAEKGVDMAEEIAKKFGQMSAQWHKEHDGALQDGLKKIRNDFHQCIICKKWACVNCWDDLKKTCITDAQVTICPKCSQPSNMGKFCTNCGSPLIVKCPKCGTEYPVDKKFCAQCGTTLQ